MEEKEIKINKRDIKIRKDFGNVSPETKIHKVKTDYQRKDNKRIIEETLEQEAEDNLDLYE